MTAGDERESMVSPLDLVCVNTKVPLLQEVLLLTPAVTELPDPENPVPLTGPKYPTETCEPQSFHVPQSHVLPPSLLEQVSSCCTLLI